MTSSGRRQTWQLIADRPRLPSRRLASNPSPRINLVAGVSIGGDSAGTRNPRRAGLSRSARRATPCPRTAPHPRLGPSHQDPSRRDLHSDRPSPIASHLRPGRGLPNPAWAASPIRRRSRQAGAMTSKKQPARKTTARKAAAKKASPRKHGPASGLGGEPKAPKPRNPPKR